MGRHQALPTGNQASLPTAVRVAGFRRSQRQRGRKQPCCTSGSRRRRKGALSVIFAATTLTIIFGAAATLIFASTAVVVDPAAVLIVGRTSGEGHDESSDLVQRQDLQQDRMISQDVPPSSYVPGQVDDEDGLFVDRGGARRSNGRRGGSVMSRRRALQTEAAEDDEPPVEDDDAPRNPTTTTTTAAPSDTADDDDDDDEAYSDGKSLHTTLVAGNGGYGAFFAINADHKLRITSIDFHTDQENKELEVEVYTKKGDYRGFEKDKTEWERLCKTTVIGAGKTIPTVIPPEEFTRVKVEKGESQSFYITLSTEDLRYTNVNDAFVGSVYVRSVDLAILVGKGVSGYPAFREENGLFNNRMFNGVVNYEVYGLDDGISAGDGGGMVISKDAVETLYPTPRTFLSTFEGGAGGFGAMFEIVPKTDIVVYGFDLHIDTQERLRVEIWTMAGSYRGFEHDRAAWTKIADTYVVSEGLGQPTPLGVDAMENILLDPQNENNGSSASFYVTLTETNLRYTNPTELQEGDIFRSNDDLDFLVGKGLTYTFGGANGKTYSPRVFNGNILYRVRTDDETSPPTSSPSVAPTPAPVAKNIEPIKTQQQISVKFPTQAARQRAIRRLMARGWNGSATTRRLGVFKDASDLPKDSVQFFEEATSFHIAQQGRSFELGNVKALVSTSISVDDLTGGGDFGSDPSDEPTLDMFTTITGEYEPPPIVDFGKVASDSFNEEGDVFVEAIKKDESFEEATGVEAREVSFDPDFEAEILQQSPSQPDEKPRKNLIIVYAVCATVGALVLAALICIVLRRIKKRRKLRKGVKSLERQTIVEDDWGGAPIAAHSQYVRRPDFRPAKSLGDMAYDDDPWEEESIPQKQSSRISNVRNVGYTRSWTGSKDDESEASFLSKSSSLPAQ